ncbi:MAG: hypothetical protein EBR32_06015 [Bacteroidetes bacterium]|nr:hypothetical protein [Bacteroidota bacterium]
MKARFLSIYIALLTVISCTESPFFFEYRSEQLSSNREVYEQFWQAFSDFYPYFKHKEVNWQAMYHVYKPLLDSVKTEEELFDVLQQMVYQLKDGHVLLKSPFEQYQYQDWYDTQFDGTLIYVKYLANTLYEPDHGRYSYGQIGNIQYVHLNSFRGAVEPYKELSLLLNGQPSSTIGLILDLRTNGGGSDVNAHEIARNFVIEETRIRWVRYRNGPAYHEFSPWISNELSPKKEPYTKPIVVITDRSVFSAAEDFVMAMQQFPQVTVLGNYTGGGSGNPMNWELPNGWLVRIPRWQVGNPITKELYEGIGIRPDTLVEQRTIDTSLGVDRMLEVAMQIIGSQ